MEIDRVALEEWQRNQPLAILQLDPADRIVLRVGGKTLFFLLLFQIMFFKVMMLFKDTFCLKVKEGGVCLFL